MSTAEELRAKLGVVAVIVLDHSGHAREHSTAAIGQSHDLVEAVARQITSLRESSLANEDEFTLVWEGNESLNLMYRRMEPTRAVVVVFRERSEIAAIRRALAGDQPPPNIP